MNNNPFETKNDDIVFKTPILEIFDNHQWNRKLPELFSRYNQLKDERAAVIFWTIVIESELDRIIRILFPKLKSLRHFNFYHKIIMLRGLQLIPENIIDFIDLAREIRNKFAHNIEIDNFEELKEIEKEKSLISKLDDYCAKFPNAITYSNYEPTYLNKFKDVGKMAIEGLRYYEATLKLMREEIVKKEFYEKLKFVAQENKRREEEEFSKNRSKYYEK